MYTLALPVSVRVFRCEILKVIVGKSDWKKLDLRRIITYY